MNTIPDFRALCAEFVEICKYDRTYTQTMELVARADAALATIPPELPTQEDLRKMFDENDWNYISPETFEDIARTVLQEWG